MRDMKERIQGVLFSRDADAAFALLEEIENEWDLSPTGFENAEQSFEGRYMESKFQGLCSDCATPYEIGETIFWQGTGKPVLCEGCRKADAWERESASETGS